MDERVNCMACLTCRHQEYELEPGVIVGQGGMVHQLWCMAVNGNPFALCQRDSGGGFVAVRAPGGRESLEPRLHPLGKWKR